MKVASTKLTNPDWERLQDKCNEQGVSIAEHLRNLIHVDLDDKESLPSKEDSAPKSSEANSISKSGLKSIFGKKILEDDRQPQPELRTEVDRMQKVLRRQNSLIQNLSDQLKEVGSKVEEQSKRQHQQALQPSHVTNSRMGCVFSGHSNRLKCYSLDKS